MRRAIERLVDADWVAAEVEETVGSGVGAADWKEKVRVIDGVSEHPESRYHRYVSLNHYSPGVLLQLLSAS